MILKAWVKFNDLNVECICTETRKKECGPEYGCSKYVVKFIPIEESVDVSKFVKEVTSTTKEVKKEIEKLNQTMTKLSKIKFLK